MAIVPLFPLPNLVLFPSFVQPLHIFEPRYRQMIGDILDGGGELVIGTVLGENQKQLAGSPAIEKIAGLGGIESYERLDDGRYNILLRGKSRVRLEEVPSDRLYRKVEVETIDDGFPFDVDEEPYRQRLANAVRDRANDDEFELPDDMPTSKLADLLLLQIKLPPETFYDLFAKQPLEPRVEAILEAHGAR